MENNEEVKTAEEVVEQPKEAVAEPSKVDEPKKAEKPVKTFTQEEVDKIVADRLARVKPSNETAEWQRKVDELQEKVGNYEKDLALKDANISKEYFDFVKFQVSKQATDGKNFKTALNEYLAGEGKKYVATADDTKPAIKMTRPENVGQDDEKSSYESMLKQAMKTNY